MGNRCNKMKRRLSFSINNSLKPNGENSKEVANQETVVEGAIQFKGIEKTSSSSMESVEIHKPADTSLEDTLPFTSDDETDCEEGDESMRILESSHLDLRSLIKVELLEDMIPHHYLELEHAEQTEQVDYSDAEPLNVKKNVGQRNPRRSSLRKSDVKPVSTCPPSEIRSQARTKRKACGVCGKRMKTFSLAEHMRIHTGEKPYQCDLCPKKFTQPGVRARHQRTHTGETPFACDICGRGFIQKVNANKHRISAHSEARASGKKKKDDKLFFLRNVLK